MNETEKPWNERVMAALRQTGESIRAEAQKLVSEVSDPANQERVKQKLAEMGDWAKKTAEEAATMVDQAAHKVEEAITQAAQRARAVRAAKKPSKAAKKPKKKTAKKRAKR
jgi:hypothetical protein